MTRSDYSNQAAPQAWFLHDEPDLETKQIAPYTITHFNFTEDFRKEPMASFLYPQEQKTILVLTSTLYKQNKTRNLH